MTYNGPAAGVLNIVSRVVTGTGAVLPAIPADDFGSDGDFALDMNTNMLYGPKDSTQIVYWPQSGLQLSSKVLYRGVWNSSNTYNTGDVVAGTGSSDNVVFLCIKPVAYNTTAWAAGAYPAGSFVTYSSQLFCAVIDATSGDVPLVATSVWKTADPYNDSTINYSYAGLGNWVQMSGSVAIDTGLAASGGKASRFIIPRNVLLNGSYGLNPVGIESGSTFPNYVIDSQSIESSSTLTTSLGNLSTNAPAATLGGGGANATVEIKDAGVTNIKLDKTAGSQAVSTGAIRDAAVTDVKLSTTGVAAGTYPKVTVTDRGRVTAGTALISTDLPLHASRHGLLGNDPVSIDATYQITSGTVPLARLDLSGIFAFKTVTANYTALISDHVIFTTTSSITVTLHSGLVATTVAGRTLRIKNNATLPITVKTASGEYINGVNYSVTGLTVAASSVLILCATGSSAAGANNWITL